jgi:hypothetical protein
MSSVRFFYGMLNNNIRMSFFLWQFVPEWKIVIFRNALERKVYRLRQESRKGKVRFLLFLLYVSSHYVFIWINVSWIVDKSTQSVRNWTTYEN